MKSQHLRDSDERFRCLFELNRDAVVITDKKGNIVLTNSSAENMFDKTKEDLLQSQFTSIISGTNHSLFNNAIKKSLGAYQKNRNSVGIVELFELKNQRYTFPAEITFSSYRNDSDVFIMIVIRDITERKKAENTVCEALHDVESANKAKSEFLTNISHEIRTPMHSIMGMTELALSANLNKEQTEYLEIIRQSADSLLFLLNSLLDFSKIESGEMKLDIAPIDLRDLLESTTSRFASKANLKGVELHLNIARDVPEKVIGDQNQLRQVCINLLDNAIKFTEEGEVFFRIKQATTKDDPDCLDLADNIKTRKKKISIKNDASAAILHFCIDDTGPGIPADVQNTVFEIFTQGDGSYTRKFGGTGLGLTITKRLVENMGGNIWVESSEGIGSSFNFIIPFGESIVSQNKEFHFS